MEALYREYRDNDNVAVFLVYINEAHPVSQANVGRVAGPRGIGGHRNIDDRVAAAVQCTKGLGLTIPILIDSMDRQAEAAYGARPAATVVVDLDGNIAFYSRGPWGAQPDGARNAINALLADMPAGE